MAESNLPTVTAENVVPGDVLRIDGIAARVITRRSGQFWIGTALIPGIALDWREVGGTARGVAFRLPGDFLDRVAP